ncbi:MAG TPA: hypothetical protein VJ695_00105 [Nitrososphaera sp.]|nr:hypothetical protein [Nitrososphaera sp.]
MLDNSIAMGEGRSFNLTLGSCKEATEKVRLWLQRHQSKLLAIDVVCLVLLFIVYLFPSAFQFLFKENMIAIQVATMILVFSIALSIVSRGIVPIVICALGVVLVHNSIILPYYAKPEPGEASFGEVKVKWTLYTPTAVSMGSGMHFFLGVSMLIFSIVVAYRPSLLFTRNRPESIESEWLKYPLWHDRTLLADSKAEYSIPIMKLVTEQERYILWRYEYILANIYGDPYLVRPQGLVPKYSTNIYRDPESGQIVGKARYNGFFV